MVIWLRLIPAYAMVMQQMLASAHLKKVQSQLDSNSWMFGLFTTEKIPAGTIIYELMRLMAQNLYEQHLDLSHDLLGIKYWVFNAYTFHVHMIFSLISLHSSSIPVSFLWIPVPSLQIPVDSSGFQWILADSCRSGRGTVKYCFKTMAENIRGNVEYRLEDLWLDIQEWYWSLVTCKYWLFECTIAKKSIIRLPL